MCATDIRATAEPVFQINRPVVQWAGDTFAMHDAF